MTDLYSEANLGFISDRKVFEGIVKPLMTRRISAAKLAIADRGFKNSWPDYERFSDQDLATRFRRQNYPPDGMVALIKMYMPQYGEQYYMTGGSEVVEVASRLFLLGLEKELKVNCYDTKVNLQLPLVALTVAAIQRSGEANGQFIIESKPGYENESPDIQAAKSSLLWTMVFSVLK